MTKLDKLPKFAKILLIILALVSLVFLIYCLLGKSTPVKESYKEYSHEYGVVEFNRWNSGYEEENKTDAKFAENNYDMQAFLRSKMYIVSEEGVDNLIESYNMDEFPKFIHVIWFQGFDVIPQKYFMNLMVMYANNLDSTLCFWDEKSATELIYKEFDNEVKETYESLDLMIKKIDFIRPAILYAVGGVYTDIDVICTNPFGLLLFRMKPDKKKVLFSKEFFGNESHTFTSKKEMIDILKSYNKHKKDAYEILYGKDVLTNNVMYSYKKQPVMFDYIKNCMNTDTTLSSCGPYVLSYTYYKQEYDNVVLLNIDLLDGMYFWDEKITLHVRECQWCGKDRDFTV